MAAPFRPLLPLLDAARDRNDPFLLVGPPSLAPLAARAGVPFEEGAEPSESVVSAIRQQLPLVPPDVAAVLANRDLFADLGTRALLPAVERASREFHPDVIVREPCEYAAAIVALEAQLPVIQVGISFADVEWGSLALAEPALEAHKQGLTEASRSTPYVTAFPSSLDHSPFATTVRLRPAAATRANPVPPLPEEWWPNARADLPLVLASFGTVAGHLEAARTLYQTAVDALDTVPARVLLTVGERFDPALLGPLPTNVRVEVWVDQERVLPHASLVLCHGGSGTTFGALAAGVPVVVVPLFADQRENARRVAACGAGVVVGAPDLVPSSAQDPASAAQRIRDAVVGALDDTRLWNAADRIASELRSAPTASAVLDELSAGGHVSLTG